MVSEYRISQKSPEGSERLGNHGVGEAFWYFCDFWWI